MPKKIFFAFISDSDLRGRIIMFLVILGVLVVAILLSGPKPVEYADLPAGGGPQATTVKSEPQPTPGFLDEEKSEYPITTGVIVGAAAILLIVEVGTLLELRRNR